MRHPFAQKMMQHFNNMGTPLQSIHQYPDLASQEHRFLDAGWSSANARSLWELWSDPSFVSSQQRKALNNVEPFDEWEEFALFASHYFLLVATKISARATSIFLQTDTAEPDRNAIHSEVDEKLYVSHCDRRDDNTTHRRFGAMISLSQDTLIHHGGLGDQSRLNTSHVYTSLSAVKEAKQALPPLLAEPRMCHTMTRLHGDNCLLVGGRLSPNYALSDCWLYKNKNWKRAQDLPIPLYRHCAASISLGTMNSNVLVFGGRSSEGKTVNDWFLWYNCKGWIKLRMTGEEIEPTFGAAMLSVGPSDGVLLGGMADDGTVILKALKWSIYDINTNPSVALSICHEISGPRALFLTTICRIGACLAWSSTGLLLVGGVARRMLPQEFDIVRVRGNKLNTGHQELGPVEMVPVDSSVRCPSPLLVGHSVWTFNDSMVVAGGGAVCFSFGTYRNQGIWSMQSEKSEGQHIWTLKPNKQSVPESVAKGIEEGNLPQIIDQYAPSDQIGGTVQRLSIATESAFEQRMNSSNPFIMESLDLGPCITAWNLDYLKARLGADYPVSPFSRIMCLTC